MVKQASTGAFLVVLAASLFLLGMGARPDAPDPGTALTAQEERLASQIGFDPAVLLLVKDTAQETLHRMHGYDETGYHVLADGFAVPVRASGSRKLLASLRQRLGPMGYQAVIVEVHDRLGMDKIGVLKGTDPYDVLRVMQTSGIEYAILNEDVIARLQEWEKRYPFTIIGAENDWVEIEFLTVPQDVASLTAIAAEVEEIAPEVIEQEFGSAEDLIKDIRSTKRLVLWWER